MRSLVVTSINPKSKLDHQRTCFQRWLALGLDAMTCNTEAESRALLEQGFNEQHIHCVSNEHTGKQLFRKPVPLIRPLLESLEREKEFDCLVLTNADIYPAVRSGSITRYWASQAPALAMTREETHDLTAHEFSSKCAYRGGLDTFFFRRDALAQVIQVLQACRASERMAFGVPGWDYLMAASIVSARVGGRICDSQVLLHQTHKATYGSVDEFSHYLPDLKSMERISSDDPSAAAEEFAAFVEDACSNQSGISLLARLLYYQRCEQQSPLQAHSPAFDEAWQRLCHLAPEMKHHLRKRTLASLFERLSSDPDTGFESTLPVICNSQSSWFQFTQALYAIVVGLKAKSASAPLYFAQQYPEGNQHRAALLNILKRHDENDPMRRLWIAKLFGSELVNHGIFNPRLGEYLVLATENDTELQLMREILTMTQRGKKHAA